MRVLSVFICVSLSTIAISEPVDFAKEIAPLLQQRCLGCHAGRSAEGSLDLSRSDAIRQGGESGPAITPGDPNRSLIWERVFADEMPENKPLSPQEKALLKNWILQGAPWNGGDLDPRAVSTDDRAGFDWWSLQPLSETSIPAVRNKAWPRNPVDYFILSRLEESNLQPSDEAEAHQLVRRLYFDVVGLPPNPGELRTALSDYASTVDTLLASVEFGQHWARHWLDVVRFGESHGFEYNQPRDNAWAYRNWVIEALNADLPYDAFVRQQIAADVLYPHEPNRWAATGFLVAGPHNTTKPSSDTMRKTMRHDELEDMVGTIGQTFLGLTINCARCHDHKFDPITQKEYYQMVASIVGVDHGERDLPDPRADRARARREKIQAELKSLRERSEQSKGKSPSVALTSRIEALEAEGRELAKIQASKLYMAVSQKPTETRWLQRGDVTTPMEVVSPAGLQAINPSLANFGLPPDSGDAIRREKLAHWLTSSNHPLLARVIVNRLWHYHFGQGIVATPSDFGFNGGRPSHPRLLDYLASKLIENHWQLKPIHRLILLSSTYRQSSRFREHAAAADADNRLLWRVAPRRLSAEQMRDAMLRVAGTLDTQHGGRGYRDMREYKYRGSHYYDPIEPAGPDAMRRTVYRFSPRGAKRTMLDTFDCPDPSTKTPRRQVTTTPLQALSLMNNPFVFQTADRVVERLNREANSDRARLTRLFALAYSRSPSEDEYSSAMEFVDQQGWAALCRVVFNSNEFLYVR